MLSLTYVSSASQLLDVPQLREMLARWRPKNQALGLTGMLLYSGGNIIQTLEGPDDAVVSTFDTIHHDPRHTGVLQLLREPIDARAFPDWSMGFRHLSREDISEVEGFNPFLQRPAGSELAAAASSAHHLMRTFKESMR